MDESLSEAFQINANYEKETLKFWREIEVKLNTPPNENVKPRIRQILICSMTDKVHKVAPTSFPDTLFSAASILDRFLCKRNVPNEKLKSVMIASLSLATKLNHTGRRSRVKDYITNANERSEESHVSKIINADETKGTSSSHLESMAVDYEMEILKQFAFDIFTPTTWTFFMAFAKFGGLEDFSTDKKCFICLGHYLAGLTLLDSEILQYEPSLIAASIIFFARYTLKRKPWSKLLQSTSGYSPTRLRDCVCKLQQLTQATWSRLLQKLPNGLPIKNIYDQEENCNVVSLVTFLEEFPDNYFERRYD